MSRRRKIVLATASVLLLSLVLVAGGLAALLGTQRGKALLMRLVVPTVAAALPGKLYIGTVSGNLFSNLTIDSLQLSEPGGAPFLSTGRVHLEYDPRDLMDRRITLKIVEIAHPRVLLLDYGNDDWNWRRALQRKGPKLPSRPGAFGQYIVVDSLAMHEIDLVVRLPWTLSDTLRGAKRDSALAFNLSRLDGEIRRDGSRFVRTWRFTRGDAQFGRIRLADPDSAGQRFTIHKLDLVWAYPPFWFRNINTVATRLGDSLWLDSTRLDISHSHGRGDVKVVWGSGLPVRYDIRLHGDSVALEDVAWIHPSLPKSGAGTTDFRMHNDPRNLSVMQYELRNMDARSNRSRIRGSMTFAVGGPVLEVTDVALDLRPANTDLLRVFNREPFPYDWQGDVTGQIVARGGPINRFQIDRATVAFADAHVPGAISRARATGVVDMYTPSETVLRGLDLDIDDLDLRTPRFVNPLFPDVTGFVRGRMRLDSLWYDARFANADLLHVDGPGDPSHVTGSGRYTLLPVGVRFEVDLQAAPLSYTTLSRSYPSLPLRGTAVGSVRASGTAEDLAVAATLAGEGGELSFDGRVDAFEPSFAVRGAFRARGLNLQTLFADAKYPTSVVSMHGTIDVAGATTADLVGPVRISIDQSSRIADARVFGGSAATRFDSGALHVDTLSIESSALRLTARGGLGLIAARRDSLQMTAFVDSLGGLRPWLVQAGIITAAAMDTLRGSLEAHGRLVGSIDTLDPLGLSLDAIADGREINYLGTRAERARVSTNLQRLLQGGSGVMLFTFDSARVAGVDIASASARALLEDAVARQFSVQARTPSESRFTIDGGVTPVDGGNRITLDRVDIRVDSGAAMRPRGFSLLAPASILFAGNRAGSLDSLVLVHTDTGRVAVRGAVTDSGAVQGALDVDRVPLYDVSRLLRGSQFTGGEITVHATTTGTRDAPVVAGTVAVRNAVSGRVRVAGLDATARYDSLRLRVDGGLNVDGRPVLRAVASLPVDLAFAARTSRQLDAPLSGQITSNRTDLSLLETLFPDVTRARGSLSTDMAITGTWARPRLRGAVVMDSAALSLENLGIRLEGATASIRLDGDSAVIERFRATSGARTDTLGITGKVRFTDADNPVFDLTLAANNFLAIDKTRTASLTVTTTVPITLTGPESGARVRGAVRVDRGRVYVSALTQRRGLDLTDNFDVIDTASTSMNALLPDAPAPLVQNLTLDNVRVNIGDDVWLRSPEANIKLGGSLRVTRAVGRDGGAARLALTDSLLVERGTYQLNLGLARPTFDVERGAVRFYGDPDLEPALDITALHTVRETRANSNRQDVRIRVAIGGTVANPSLTLSSADNPPLPESDMLSYLVTGEPANALFETSYAEQGATLALRLASSYFSSRLAGGRFDVVQIEPTALNPGDVANLRENGLGILASTRVGLGGQIARNTYLTLTTGLCGFAAPTGSDDALSLFAKGLGVKIERRFEGGLAVALGLEPASSAQSCGRQGLSRVFQQTPAQFGLDFFRSWTF